MDLTVDRCAVSTWGGSGIARQGAMRIVYGGPIVMMTLSVALAADVGCGGGTGLKGGSGGGGLSGGTTGLSGGTAGGGETGNGGATGSGGRTSVCYVDYPCSYPYRCQGSGYQTVATNWDCHSKCGPGPCSGATCDPVGEEVPCPSGTHCVSGASEVSRACQPVDAGVDAGLKGGLEAGVDAGVEDARDGTDACADGICAQLCTPGQQRCDALVPQTCSAIGAWQDGRACLYRCNAGSCSGECTPGARRCRDQSPQICDANAVWVDEQACSGTTPSCAEGRCVALCLDTGADCKAPTTSCCEGSECVSSDGGATFLCRTVPRCAAVGNACTVTADCCAGLDCSGGRCATREQACLEKPEDGVCGGTSAGACCPGTLCGTVLGSSSLGCAIPPSTKPEDYACPRDKPSQHRACSAARFGLACTYSDWIAEPGVFYTCTCSYHGWSCIKGYNVNATPG